MRERENLSIGEQQYLSSKTTVWKVVSFFLPGIGQIWSKRRGLFWGGTLIAIGLGLLGYAAGGGEAMNGAGRISWLLNVILTLVKFTEKAYRHDMPYFQRYLDEYAKLSGGTSNTKKMDETDKNPRTNENKNAKFDKYGFDEDGYNREGYDAYGIDRDGYNREGYNVEGFDRNGFDKNGYNYKGFDKDGYDKNGYDRAGYDKEGYKRDGYDRAGYDREGYKRDGYDKMGIDREGYDRAGYDREGYNKEGYDDEGFDKNGLNKEGYDKYGKKKEAVKKPTIKKVAKKNVRK